MRDSEKKHPGAVVRHRATGIVRRVVRSGRSLVGEGRGRYLIAVGALALAAGGATTWAMVGDRQPGVEVATTNAANATADAAERAADRASRSRAEATPTPAPTATPKASTAAPAAKASQPATTPAPAKTTPSKAPTTAKATVKAAPAWVLPMSNFELTSCYGPRWGTVHQGIDFAGDYDTPIKAVHGGTVIMAGDDGDGYGVKVVIDHGGYYTLYGHANRTIVEVGQRVATGQTISYEGSTGDSTGPHLHFEVWSDLWVRFDPGPWLRSHGLPLAGC